jgi:polysaccharide biosynthesis transport protein
MNRRSANLSITSTPSRVSPGGPFVIYPARALRGDTRRLSAGECLDVIYQRRWWVLGAIGVVTGAVWLVSMLMPRVYESSATLEIERAPIGALAGSGNMFPLSPPMDELMATHIRMLQGDAVLRPVAERFGLSGALRNGPVKLKGLGVARVPETSLLQISYRDRDARTAAAVVNGVAESYLSHLRDVRSGALSSLSEASRRQLAEIEQRAMQSALAVTEFERKRGARAGGEKTGAVSDQVTQLNASYARAQADRIAKEAALESARGDGLTSARAMQAAEAAVKEARAIESRLRDEYERAKAESEGAATRVLEYRMLQQRADADRALYEELSRKISEAEIDNGLRDAPVRLAEAARADSHPVSPNVPLNCAIALLISVVGACGGAVVLESRGHRIRGADDLGSATGARMVARLPSVPAWRGLNGFSMFSDASHTIQAGDLALPRFREQVRILRNGLLQISGKPGERAIAVMSPSPGEGRSRVAAELAMAFAASGQRTLLIDANLRAPVLHALLFSTGPRDGLASSLAGETRWRACVRKAEQEGFDLLPSGAADARSFDLMHQHFADIVEQARGEYQCVVVDSPPFLCCSESLDIARAVDAVIVMARAKTTDERVVETMMDYVQRWNVQVGAVVINDA